MKNFEIIFKKLKQFYTVTKWSEHMDRNAFEVLISCILSLRTKDEVTYKASQRLFAKARTPLSLSKLDTETIEKLIYPVGFYKTKAKTIQNIAKIIHEQYNDIVPDTIDELLKLKGVGRKTANIVLVYGHNKPGMAIDTHAHRIPNRIGWIKTKTPDETEEVLRKQLPKKYWMDFNELMVRHGQQTCKPISPLCSKCPIKNYCEKIGVEKSR
ncbi:endonuclease III [Candidatus Woesearchaeota archaeon]|nr:endonuclease III [Candidatus Woesearchaeota archaeon]MBW3022315.1 endonuclease III [Candidatus Woesearchaeota archaeon]